ncbi:hypothetical protein BTA51_18530 [Hahella sp. CCB-MM4]|nr:hypothetical protein BTA51_18530 [Hahella sp. CCB-MM4]
MLTFIRHHLSRSGHAALVSVVCLGVLLSACTPKEGIKTSPEITETMPEDEAEQQLWLAQRAISTERADYLLNALEIYLTREDYSNAERTVNTINTTTLSSPQYERYILLAGKLAMILDKPELAITYFEEAPSEAFTTAPLPTQLDAVELRANALLAAGRPLEAARFRAFNAGLFTGEAYWENHNKIWNALRAVPALELSRALEQPQDYDWQGWLELINQIRLNQYSLDQQLVALNQWRENWPTHAASQHLPDELQMLIELPNTRPKKIALILPLSGPLEKVGAAIRDGFFAAFYADAEVSSVSTEINVIDSEQHDSIIDLYLQLQIEDYDLVVGPLQKDQVSELALLPQMNPPVLALNYADTFELATPGLFQYGLAAEDEIRQILDYLDSQKKSRIAAIYPNAAWAEELVNTLKEREQGNDNFQLLSYEYTPEDSLSNGISALLDIEDSDERFRDIRNILGKVEFEPRRRQDIDAAILIATPTIGRQLKPLLAFHYASDVPVYATSQIYAGFQQKDKDHDLDNIRFTEVPWLLSQTIPLRSDIKYLAGINRYERLYAMGIDAYHLAPRLALMERFPSSQLPGMTGNLAINEKNQIRRQLEWATFENGQVKTLLTLSPQ